MFGHDPTLTSILGGVEAVTSIGSLQDLSILDGWHNSSVGMLLRETLGAEHVKVTATSPEPPSGAHWMVGAEFGSVLHTMGSREAVIGIGSLCVLLGLPG
jgi:hypothetical protein